MNINQQELKKELQEHQKNAHALFDAAWNLNMSGQGTDLSRMVTTYLPGMLQTMGAIIERIPDKQ